MRKPLLPLALVLGAGSLTGCPDDGNRPLDMNVLVPHNFQQINDEILQPSCGNFSVCHSAEGASQAGHLDFSVDAYQALVGVAADNKMAKAENRVRVQPCDAEDSFLWIKLNLPLSQKEPKVGYGASMPRDNAHLLPEQLAGIHDWIARGAHRDEPDDVTGSECVTDDGGPDIGVRDIAPTD